MISYNTSNVKNKQYLSEKESFIKSKLSYSTIFSGTEYVFIGVYVLCVICIVIVIIIIMKMAIDGELVKLLFYN